MMDASAPVSRSPLKQALDIRRDEWPRALFMFGYFFLVITTFWILKPLKKGLFVEFYNEQGFSWLDWTWTAAQAEQFAKVGNMFVALAAMAVFAHLSRTFRREKLTFIFCAAIAVACAVFAGLSTALTAGSVWSFYFFGDLYSTLMVAAFFAFLNDAVTPSESKRLYGLIVLGGVTGGAFGSTVLSAFVRDLSLASWLWICAGLTLLVAVCAGGAGRAFRRSDAPPEASASDDAAGSTTPRGWAGVEAARLVFRSRYLLSVVAIVGLYEMVSTIMDFQFTATVAHYLTGSDIGAHFSRVFAITNIVALIVQLFFTSFVMTRFGVGAALLVLPAAALAGSAAFFALPVLWFGSLLNTADNGFSYSINQSAKEALYTTVSREEKYEAKAFIDMFVQRFAKAIGVGVSLLITTSLMSFAGVRWLSLATLATLAVWIWIARYAGREFQARSAEAERSAETAAPTAVQTTA